MSEQQKRGIIISVAVVAGLVIIGVAYYFSSSVYKQDAGSSFLDTAEGEQATQNFNAGNVDDSIKAGEARVKGNPNDVDALLFLAASYAEKGSVEFQESQYGSMAIDTANKVLAIDPTNSEAYRLIGYGNEIQQRYSDAMTAYDMSIKLDAGNALAYSDRGHASELQGDYAKAQADYETALSIQPDLDHALLNVAKIYIRNSDFAKASSSVGTLESSSQNIRIKAEGEALFGNISMQTSKYSDALAAFNQAIQYDNNLALAYVGRAQANFALLEPKANDTVTSATIQSVFNDLGKATGIYPNQTSAYMLSGKILGLLNQKDDAKKVYAQASQVVDKDITLTAQDKVAVKAMINTELASIK